MRNDAEQEAVRYSNGSATALDKGCNISRFHVARMAGECLHPQAPSELSEKNAARATTSPKSSWNRVALEWDFRIMPNVVGPFFWDKTLGKKGDSSEAKSHSFLVSKEFMLVKWRSCTFQGWNMGFYLADLPANFQQIHQLEVLTNIASASPRFQVSHFEE